MTEREDQEERDQSRRDFVQKVAWVAPVVLSLAATASFARAASDAEPPT